MSDPAARPEESLPLSVEERIDAVCQSFEAAWKAVGDGGTRPRIEDCLDAVPEPEQGALLAELLKVELHYRRGERPTPEEYQRRFPRHGARIAGVFAQMAAAPGPVRQGGGGRETVRAATAQETGHDPNRTALESPPLTPEGQEPAAAAPALPTIPGYDILGVLGRGGMGVVYRARHVRLNRLVALKMILAGGHAGEEELARFRSEAELVARLQHPNVVQIYEIGDHAGLPYFSLEFVDGGSLHQKLAGAPQQPEAVAQLVETLARAVHAAHQRGVVHRDLKPANVLLTRDGVPKVTDFGLAKHLDEDSGRTQIGAVMGTPSYMAPEQAEGRTKEIGPPADVWALGAILYETLTGNPPFKGATVRDTLEQVCTREPVPVRQLQPKVPRDLETICLKCLQKAPPKRYGSALELAEDLWRFLDGKPVLARPVGRLEKAAKWARRNPAGAAFVTALVIGTVVSMSLAVCAVQQADLARGNEAAAVNANITLEAKKTELEQTQEELLTTLARSLLRPLAVQAGPLGAPSVPLTDPEIDALRELAEDRSGKLGPRFVEEALRSPACTRQLRARAELAIHAAVGLDPDRRAQVERLLGERLQDPNLSAEQRTDIALVAMALGELTPTTATRVAQTLAQAIAKTTEPGAVFELAGGLSVVATRMEPKEAADILTQAMAQTNYPLALHPLADGLSAVAARMGPQEAALRCTRAADTLAQAMDKMYGPGTLGALTGGDRPAPGAGGGQPYDPGLLSSLAEGLSALAARMESEDASRRCARAADTLIQAMAKEDDTLHHMPLLVEGLSALASRLGPRKAAGVADALAQVMAQKTTNPLAVFELAVGLSALVARMEPKEAAQRSTQAADSLIETISRIQIDDTDALRQLAKDLPTVAGRLGPRAASPAADVLIQAMARTLHPGALRLLANGLSAVAVRLEPREFARATNALALAGVPPPNNALHFQGEDITFPEDVAFPGAGMANVPAPNNALHKWAEGLLAMSSRMGPQESAQAADALTQAMTKTNDPKVLSSLAVALSALASRLEPARASRAADTLIKAMIRMAYPGALTRLTFDDATTSDDFALDTVASLAVSLSAVAARMEPEDAARRCAQAADTLAPGMARTNNPFTLRRLAKGLLAVATQMEPQDAARTANTLTQAIAKARIGVTWEDDFDRLSFLAEVLSALLTQTDRPELSKRSRAVLAAVGLQAGRCQPLALPAILAPALEPLPCLFSTSELVELLKQPTCNHAARWAILDQLKRRYHRKFADHWAFVRFAQEQNLGLDFTSPPMHHARAVIGPNGPAALPPQPPAVGGPSKPGPSTPEPARPGK